MKILTNIQKGKKAKAAWWSHVLPSSSFNGCPGFVLTVSLPACPPRSLGRAGSGSIEVEYSYIWMV